jgi:hypothetical protein
MKYEVAEFFMGHTVDPLGYDKAYMDERYYRRQYMEASEYLNILSESKAYGLVELEKVENERITELENELKRMKEQQEETLQYLKKLTEGA